MLVADVVMQTPDAPPGRRGQAFAVNYIHLEAFVTIHKCIQNNIVRLRVGCKMYAMLTNLNFSHLALYLCCVVGGDSDNKKFS